ncbi:hypothetical protein T4E_2604 [Trichinella pseudospiralis]|uniref:Fibrous sheath-interacting protein 1 n=1 Tax=Trichinella pseudospiralis TaxID=6337 RepID=A0A0V1FN48_TRIPS|nr:hypothetical protein T4E_2604 [Trichinella pseudospiralis]KRY87464.1 hypothetical protein T4D_851 [Trichinella pseudospiralis]
MEIRSDGETREAETVKEKATDEEEVKEEEEAVANDADKVNDDNVALSEHSDDVDVDEELLQVYSKKWKIYIMNTVLSKLDTVRKLNAVERKIYDWETQELEMEQANYEKRVKGNDQKCSLKRELMQVSSTKAINESNRRYSSPSMFTIPESEVLAILREMRETVMENRSIDELTTEEMLLKQRIDNQLRMKESDFSCDEDYTPPILSALGNVEELMVFKGHGQQFEDETENSASTSESTYRIPNKLYSWREELYHFKQIIKLSKRKNC